MVSENDSSIPKLRPLDTRPFLREGQWQIALRDPLRLTDKTLFLPQAVAPILGLLDGTRDLSGLHASLVIRYGIDIMQSEIEQLIRALDEIFLLDNDRAAEAMQRSLEDYRHAPFREPALAGGSYPEDPDALRDQLQSYLDQVEIESTFPSGRGLISPHIDYQRGGPVYAAVWGTARDWLQEAELAIILGTDHYAPGGQLTLTRQNYATPLGILPTAQDIVDDLATSLGEEKAFRSELYHRGEHSIELALNWLHFIRNAKPLEIVPILCGTYEDFFGDVTDPENDPKTTLFTQSLRTVIAGRNAIVIAAGDLAHVGTAFGGLPLDFVSRANLQTVDEALLEQIQMGDENGFLERIRGVEDAYHVCGVVPIYLSMRTLKPTQGHVVAYDRCPADEEGTSLVSICGVVFE